MGVSVIWNFSVWLILMKWWSFFNFFIVANANIPFPLTLRKPETQTLGVGHLEFFCTIDINKMAALFWFFYNGKYWSSISIDTQTGDPNFGGVSNLKCFCTIDINEMMAIFQFFHNGQWWYSLSVNTQKTADLNFWGG